MTHQGCGSGASQPGQRETIHATEVHCSERIDVVRIVLYRLSRGIRCDHATPYRVADYLLVEWHPDRDGGAVPAVYPADCAGNALDGAPYDPTWLVGEGVDMTEVLS